MTNAAFHVMARSEIPDIGDSNIPDRLTEKQEEEEHMQLLSVLRFSQTQ